jgi:AcrR family transcriptional regulator
MHSKLHTTQNIIQSAADLFLNNGFSNVSMDLVAETADVTKVTVYQHFKSKEVLLLHCLRWRLDSREGYLEAHFKGKTASCTQVLEVFEWMGQKANKGNFHGCAFLKATNELGATIPEVREIALEAKRLIRKRMVNMLRSGSVAHAEIIGDTLALLLEGAQALSLIEQSARPFKAAKREAESLLAQYVSSASNPVPSVLKEN